MIMATRIHLFPFRASRALLCRRCSACGKRQNTEVKLVRGESTWHIAPGRIGSCRISINNPFFDFSYKKPRIIRGFWSKIRAFYKICPRFVHGFFGIYRGLILFRRYDCIQYLQSFGIHCFGLVRVSLERRRYVFVPEPCRYDF